MKGSFGEIMFATHKQTKIDYAVKIISKNLYKEVDYQIILNEIEILKKLDHPHILKIFEYY